MNKLISLPKSKVIVTGRGDKGKIPCLIRSRLMDDGAEERVRQRVLDWLINFRKWPKELIDVEVSHKWISDENKNRVRSDIELFNSDKNSEVVIECKAPSKKLTPEVFRQALNYAYKSGAKSIWITNGEEHKFKEFVRNKWEDTDSLKILKIRAPVPKIFPDLPAKLSSSKIDEYLLNRYEIGDPDFTEHSLEFKRIVTALYKLFFHTPLKLPYSTNSGFHILQDYGPKELKIKNAGHSNGYSGWYRGFATGTTGRIATLYLGISFASRNAESAQICVVTEKNGEYNHVLQLRLEEENCILDKTKKIWEISHDGKMSRGDGYGISMENVMDAVKESGLGHQIIKVNNGRNEKEFLKLGHLQFPELNFSWENSMDLITNILLYGMVRHNLRIVLAAKNKRK